MKSHLIDMFLFNREANSKMVSSFVDISGNGEILKHLSHLANCQYKWLGRIRTFPEAESVSWWEPVYEADELLQHFSQSTQFWLDYLNGLNEEDLENRINFARGASGSAEVSIKDIALQLIFHSFHHRAQIQMMIREKGIPPEGIDYIRSRMIKKGES